MITKRKLKSWVLPAVYALAVIVIAISVILIGRAINNFVAIDDNSNYVINGLTDDDATPVINETPNETTAKNVIKPFIKEGVNVIKEFYDKNAAAESQVKALIFYEGTYMQNTGILYSSAENFDVVAVMDGTITNIKEDDLLGIIVEIEHNSKVRSVYQSLGDTKLSVGDTVKQGDIIGTSGQNKIDTSSKYELLFEVYKDGTIINPNTFYEMKLEDLA